MIEIRPDQFQTLAHDHRDRFHRQILAMLKESAPELETKKTDEELLATIETAHRRATEKAITLKPDVARFAGLEVFSGPDFDRHPVVENYLYREPGSISTKLELLYERMGAASPPG
jgi:hypothetical protein